MTNDAEIWPPEPQLSVDDPRWDGILEAEQAKLPNREQSRRLVLMNVLHENFGVDLPDCATIVNRYFTRRRRTDAKYRLTWAQYGYIVYVGLMLLVIMVAFATRIIWPHSSIALQIRNQIITDLFRFRLLIALLPVLISTASLIVTLIRVSKMRAVQHQRAGDERELL